MSPAFARSLVTGLVILLVAAPASAGEPGPDPVGVAWRARAELATKKLAGPGLDACDRAVELAFQHAEATVKGIRREYLLPIEVEGSALLVLYGYEGPRLDTFAIAALPPGWFAYQKADSKTLTVLLSKGSKCALDLCTSGPTANGSCPEQQRAR